MLTVGTLTASTFTPGSQSSSYAMTGTYAAIVAALPNAPDGTMAYASDLGAYGITVRKYGSYWYINNSAYTQLMPNTTSLFEIVANFNGAPTYTQSTTTVSVAWASHGFTALLNGSRIYLPIATGGLSSGWYTDFAYVDANNFTCVSAASGSNSGTLGKNRYKEGKENRPDLTGNIHVDRNLLIDLLTKHKDKPLIQLRLSAWNKQNNDTGEGFLGIAVSEPTPPKQEAGKNPVE